VCVYICSTVARLLALFHTSASVNGAAINMGLQAVFLQHSDFIQANVQ
jgi:hypothetical protein